MNERVLVKKFFTTNRGWSALLMGIALAIPAALPAQVSLATVVDLAQRNSGAVRIAAADVQKAQAALAQSRDAFIPSVDIGSGLPALPSVGFTGGVPSIINGSVQSMVFSLPQKRYIDAAQAGLKAANMNLKSAREQVALDASTTYIELDTVNRELDAAGQQQGFSERLVSIERERAEAGVDPLNELLQAQLTAAELKLKRLHLETRAQVLARQLAALTGLPVGSISPDHASIPEIPAVKADATRRPNTAVRSAELLALSKQRAAQGDRLNEYIPQLGFNAIYVRSTTILNDFNNYYRQNIPPDNFSSGISIDFPVFDWRRRDKARESAADALRARVEAEQAQRQSEIQIAELSSSLRELDAQAEIASLKQQISSEQIKTVEAQLELGNGSGSGPGATPQLSPKAGQLARIDERQKYQDALDAGLDLSKARLNLLRALGHMQDWLDELHAK